MNLVWEILGMLAFRSRALRYVAAQRAVLAGWLVLGIGFLAFVLVRDSVYAVLDQQMDSPVRRGFVDTLWRLNLVQALLFLSLVYVPAIISLSNAFAGDGLNFWASREEYRTHVSVLFPLWGILFLLTAPLQWLLPHFVVLGPFGISFGLLGLTFLMLIYTTWAIKQINYISAIAALGVFVLSWMTLPVFYLLTMFFFAVPLFILIPLAYLAFQRWRGFLTQRSSEQGFQRHLHSLTINPQNADAHHQLGLIHFERGNLDTARTYFENALRIDPDDPDSHYFLGRVFEEKGEWPKALEQYEETYRMNPDYHLGDIFREVGKGYLQTGKLEKALEFLRFFLNTRDSDPQGRYWLAVGLQKLGRNDEMRAELRTVLDQARSNPRFFRKENREWIYRSRLLLRQASP